MKLDVAAGSRKHKGYKTIDIDPKHKPDYLGDFRQMSFENVETIRAHHILEHFGREEGKIVLKMWYDWLKEGGVLLVETPDFEEICKGFAKGKYWMTRHAYGSQDADWAYHKDGWYEEKFREVLPKIGFKITQIKRRITRGILPSILVWAEKI